MKKQTDLLKYIYNQRWCNFKEDITKGNVKNIIFKEALFDNDKKFFIIGKAEIKNKNPVFFIMPLAKGVIDGESSIKYKNYDVYDALKAPDYWSSLMQSTCFNKPLTISDDYSLIYQSWFDLDFITNHLKDNSVPLNVEQSNTTLSIGNDVIAFKQQRLIEFSNIQNPEIEMNYNLMKSKCSVVPKTYGHLFLLSPKGESALVGIVQEFIPNKGDLWSIATKKLSLILRKALKNKEEKIFLKDIKDLRGIIKNLGLKTSEMLKCLSSFKGEDLKPETITLKYVKDYKEKLQNQIALVKNVLLKNIDSFPDIIKNRLNILLNNWEKYMDTFIKKNLSPIMKRKRKGKLMRVHGDFHLGQVILSKKGEIKLIDFAGEPNVSFEKRREKHPSQYDIAGMYRSINGYLEASVIKKYARNDKGELNIQKLASAYQIIHPIIEKLTEDFLSQQNIDKEWLNLEILRRNLYEIDYELAYRPKMLSVPVLNLLNLLNVN
ncbi:hypothetical protein HDR59_03595 [bacterium]|nr:hypothetical protein [bacterium]